MAEIYDCVSALKNLLNVQYVLGRKSVNIFVKVCFEKLHFYHLMGLHYIKDVRQLDEKAAVVFDKLYNHEIKEEIIQSSMQYSRIRERVCFLRFLESIMDDNRTVFKYNKKENAFSLIQADFLLKNAVENRNIFLFLAKSDNDFYFCRSFSPNRR